jgi:hypothetical protein
MSDERIGFYAPACHAGEAVIIADCIKPNPFPTRKITL